MTEEEKKELQELRDMKELQELRALKEKQEQKEVVPANKKEHKGGNGCAVWLIIGFVVMLVMVMCMGTSNGRKENYNDNSMTHQILAKNYFKDYMKDNRLKDPGSYEEISYTSSYNGYRQCYVVDLKFRARNSFGGMAVERWMADVKFKDGKVSFDNITKLE